MNKLNDKELVNELYHMLMFDQAYRPYPPNEKVRKHWERQRDVEKIADYYVIQDFTPWETLTEYGKQKTIERFYKRHKRTGINSQDNPISGPGDAKRVLMDRYSSWTDEVIEKVLNKARGNVLTARRELEKEPEDTTRYKQLMLFEEQIPLPEIHEEMLQEQAAFR